MCYFCIVKEEMKKFLTIATVNDLVRLAPEKVVYISADGNYCHIMQTDGTTRLVTIQLGKISDLIEQQGVETTDYEFMRVGKSLLINKYYVTYINIPQQQLVLSDARTFTHTVSASKDALKRIKEDLECQT